MKSKSKILLTILPLILLTRGLEAQGVILGNFPDGEEGFVLAADAYVPFGGAVEFTPLQSFSLASVTVWLTGYTGWDIYGQPNSFYAEIYSDAIVDPGGLHSPGTLLSFLNIPAPNDGSLTPMTLNSSAITLEANTPYWLLLYASGAQANMGWVGGNIPRGEAIYNGSEYFSDFAFYPSAVTPAFTINAVPEPRPMTMNMFVLFCAGIYAIRFSRNCSGF